MEQSNIRRSLREVARTSLMKAREIRQAMSRKIQDLKDGLRDPQRSKSVNLTARLEEIENLLKQLRLASMEVIFYDFDYAHEKDVEATLWQAHVSLNGEYRQVVTRVNTQNQVVLKRKVDKLYRDFLKTSQFFYRGYIQRLSGQFGIPELQEAARGLDIGTFELPQGNNAPSPNLRVKVVNSCYLTLVRLGDLARYRCQASDKPPKASFDIALTYYGLAQMIDPNDGASYHQTALLYQPSAKHLEIIYYFLRSVCVAKPHKLGSGNLERAFKSPLDSQSNHKANTRNSASKDPLELLTTWFLKLHAHYAQGVTFSAREELEKEVLHRFQVCLRTEGSEELTLKMMLLSLAACDIAFEKVKDASTWTIELSQSCQYLLIFNVRLVVVLFRVLQPIIKENAILAVGTDNTDHDGLTVNEVESSRALERILPLVRICVAWTYASRTQLAQYQEWLEPHIRDLYALLADALTLLLPYAITNEEVPESKYLLQEDTEALGLRPFSDRKLPLFLDVQILPGLFPTKCRKTIKPRKAVFDTAYNTKIESVWRIRDILCCGIYLAGSGKVPITISVNDGMLTWVYLVEGNNPTQLDESSILRTLGQLKMSAQKIPMAEDDVTETDAAITSHRTTDSVGHQLNEPSRVAHVKNRVQVGQKPPAFSAVQPSDEFVATPIGDDLRRDNDMVEMVSKLIDDDDDIPYRSSKAQAEPSYGMDSSVANDVFGNLISSPDSISAPKTTSPGVSGGKTIPSLPWNYFYSPSPVNGTSPRQSKEDDFDVPRFTGAQIAAPGSAAFVDQYTYSVNSHQSPNPQATLPTSYGQSNKGVQKSTIPSPSTRSDLKSPTYSADQRSAALDNLKSALYAQYGTSSSNSVQPGNTWRQSTHTTSNAVLHPSQRHRSNASNASSTFADNLDRFSPKQSGKNKKSLSQGLTKLQLGQKQTTGTTQPPIERPGGTKNGAIVQTSALSPTSSRFGFNRPSSRGLTQDRWAGSPASSTTSFAQQLPSLPGNDSAIAFSNTSSLWGGTPATTKSPQGTVACNGNFFNASTPFGRIGDTNNREDPTHFRNLIKGIAGGDTISAYDNAILQSALADDSSVQTRKQ